MISYLKVLGVIQYFEALCAKLRLLSKFYAFLLYDNFHEIITWLY